MVSQMNNRFFTYTDPSSNYCGSYYLEPNFFWSRLYEYAFALNLIQPSDISLDSAAGVYHPFKFALTDLCRETYVCDLDNLSKEYVLSEVRRMFGDNKYAEERIDKIHFNQCNLISLPYLNKMFDKIFCISVFEHLLEQDQLSALKEFKRTLKDDGLIILTCDYPSTKPEQVLEMVKECGLKVFGEYDYTLLEDAIFSDYFGSRLYCYNMLLVKE